MCGGDQHGAELGIAASELSVDGMLQRGNVRRFGRIERKFVEYGTDFGQYIDVGRA